MAAALQAGAVDSARADELETLHQQILQHPGNSELNLRFAQLAESSGYQRWALSAYERVVLNDPSNTEGQKGLQRIRTALKPDTTLVTIQVGAQYESTPRYYLPPRHAEMQAVGLVTLFDERKAGDARWRTEGAAAAVYHGHEHDLNFGVVGAETGPVLDIDFLPGWTFHPAVGGSGATFENRFYYSEGSASGIWESSSDGIYRSFGLRGAHRTYDQFFQAGNGFYVEGKAKVAVPGVLGAGSLGVISPWVVWSDISGGAQVVVPFITELQPGSYLEYGARLDIAKQLATWLIADLNIGVSQRNYRDDIVISSGELRRDRIVSPGLTLLFPSLFAPQFDLRLDYRYLIDYSNDPTKRFNDHIVTAQIVTRFDPTAPLNATQAGGSTQPATAKQ